MWWMRSRIVGMLIGLAFAGFMHRPMETSIVLLVLGGAYYLLKKLHKDNLIDDGYERRRKEALRKAAVFLTGNGNIWSNLKLSNDFCYLTLGSDGITIEGFEKVRNGNSYRTFKVLASRVHEDMELWNMFCKTFSYNKRYEGLIEDCSRFRLIIQENILQKSPIVVDEPQVQTEIETKEQIDINNCTLEELTNLAGVSVIMAKKAMKKREEDGGFGSLDEFFEFLNIKPHIQEQLRPTLKVTPVKGYKKFERSEERNVDF